MPTTKYEANSKQLLFREMVLGILVYAVVLGFFNDYTRILSTESYSVTFLVAIVMQLLTYLTILSKKWVAKWFQPKTGSFSKLGLVIGVWLVLFLSKFVFLAAIDLVFGQAVEISGFIGLMAIIVSMTVVKELIDFMFEKLAD